jgi:type II secretory pathway component PulK
MLLRLLLALGAPPAEAPGIAAAIVDWRTPATRERPGTFDAFYLAQSPSFLPAHTSFQQNEELLLVKGVTNDLYFGDPLSGRPGLRDCLSIYGGSGGVEINTAQAATLIAIGLSEEDAAAVIRRRAQHPILRHEELNEIQQALGPAGRQLFTGGNTIFTLRATARPLTADGRLSDMRRTVSALMKFHFQGNKQNVPPGFEVLNWYDRP